MKQYVPIAGTLKVDEPENVARIAAYEAAPNKSEFLRQAIDAWLVGHPSEAEQTRLIRDILKKLESGGFTETVCELQAAVAALKQLI